MFLFEKIKCPNCGNEDDDNFLVETAQVGSKERVWIGFSCPKCKYLMREDYLNGKKTSDGDRNPPEHSEDVHS
jgi:hypothetical protein